MTLSAWGDRGPWGTRRGFDSLVQAATGIAVAVREDPPGALPVQALAATAHALLAAGRRDVPADAREPDPAPHLTAVGRLRVALPPGELAGTPLGWPAA